MTSNPIPTLNLDEWGIDVSKFNSIPTSLGLLRSLSPADILYRDWLREQLDGVFRARQSVPTDAFALALGEPPRRDVTKIGGLPFWPKSKAWPIGKNGEGLQFMFQFRFVESKDLMGELPGDLLIVFFPMRRGNFTGEMGPDIFGFEDCPQAFWIRVSDEPLVTMEDMPDYSYSFLMAYGVRHRMQDIVADAGGLHEVDQYLLGNFRDGPSFRDGPWISRWLSNSLFIHPAVKVGGLPFTLYKSDSEPPGKFLCGISNLIPRYQEEWPFVNRQLLVPKNIFGDEELELFPSDGLLQFTWYLGRDGKPVCAYEYQLDVPLHENEPRD